MDKEINIEKEIEGVKYSFNIGKLANQASGAVLARAGETVVLSVVTMSKEINEELDFFPLTVDYIERMYAAGKIPGGFFKRGGKSSDYEVLKSRLIDRSIRPLFPKYIKNEVQVICYVLSSDGVNQPDILAINATSIALSISEIPFNGPVSAVRIGRMDDKFITNSPFTIEDETLLDLVVAKTRKAVVMVESGSKEISLDLMMEAFSYADAKNDEFLSFQEEILSQLPLKEKAVIQEPVLMDDIKTATEDYLINRIENALFNPIKQQRENAVDNLKQEMHLELDPLFPERTGEIDLAFDKFVYDYVRRKIVLENKRPDGRAIDEIRPISIEVGLLPRVHGSGLFKRGQTQVLTLVTLGAKGEGQLVEGLLEEELKHYMHYYNFPPFSVGEVRPLRGPGRREVGHGALAERALIPVVPTEDEFPYTIHVVSEVLESNGSSSMASVCGSTLALMDAGIPIKAPVAGIAMGLITNEDTYCILTDIQGVEDATGEMDFKVAGTNKGITALQMDVKTEKVNLNIIREGLERATKAYLFILDKIQEVISTPRQNLSKFAPRMQIVKINPEKIGELIGPQGKVIKKIIEDTGAKIDIESDGKVYVSAPNEVSINGALDAIKDITEDIEIGHIYKGRVTSIRDYGAFVEIKKGKEGLLHISQISNKRIPTVDSVLKLGQEVTVKVIGIDDLGRISLTMKGLSETENNENNIEE
ncbi:MAG: polyribonucleotide nucleotidyltransferase [Caldisericia bacterium]|nr:polyribonucleotide nucleotidyltransferase [Caldisericia bacterium]